MKKKKLKKKTNEKTAVYFSIDSCAILPHRELMSDEKYKQHVC